MTPDPYRALVSYWFCQRDEVAQLVDGASVVGVPPQLFADSGAFSAYQQGQRIDVGAYGEWLLRWRSRLAVYANLDVIGDYRGSARNLAALEALGLAPLPVWHAGSPREVLRDLCAAYRYVAIGNLVGQNRNAVMAHAPEWFRIAGEAGAALHGFGLTRWEAVASLPWYSVDSASITAGTRFGRMHLFDPAAGRWITVPLYDRREWGRWGHLVRPLGFDPEDFIDPDRYRRITGLALSILSWRRAEAYLRARMGAQALPPGDRPEVGTTAPGLHLYPVDSSINNQIWHARAIAAGRWDPAQWDGLLGSVEEWHRRGGARRKPRKTWARR